MSQQELEERLVLLEREVAALKLQARRPQANGPWLEHVAGSMQAYPEFSDVLELGRQARACGRPADNA